MTNIIIDASGMFYRSLYTIEGVGFKEKRLLDSEESRGVFMRKLATDFTTAIKNLTIKSRVIACLDSSSWRKTVEIKGGGYKHDRKSARRDDINWDEFYNLTEEFSKILSTKGYIISKIETAEADDLLYLWSRKLNKKGECVILISGDKDLTQVVQQYNNSWTVLLDPVNKRKRISLTQETYNFKDDNSSNIDIFNPSSWNTNNDFLEELLGKFELVIVDPNILRIKKILFGDRGDSVPGIVSWIDKKNPNITRSITENNIEKILESYPGITQTSWKKLSEGCYIEEICSRLEELRKIEVDRDLALSNIKRNTILTVLHNNTIPDDIAREIDKADISDCSPILGQENILEGTKWYSEDKNIFVPTSYDLFS